MTAPIEICIRGQFNRAHTRTDALNLTNIFDVVSKTRFQHDVTPANNAALWYSPANRLQNADGPWGSETFYYDGVGNRIEQRLTPPGGSETISVLGYPATSNRVVQVTQGAATVRSIGYDAAGNITSDNRLGSAYAYTYNHANRLKTVSYEGNLKGTYTYNGLSQLITRVVTNSGSADGTTHYVHDRGGNVIAELDASGATSREYIWLAEAEIAPTAASRAPIDRPIAVVDGVGGGSPTLYYVHTDHLHRPIRMSDAATSMVWQAEYQPWGAVQSLSGPLTLDLRFPGQWFQLEAGLHYNWHRHYDASLGRYTQADPLGFVDGPGVFGYAGGSPLRSVDPEGLAKGDSINDPNKRRRRCSSMEMLKCIAQCGTKGVEKCFVDETKRLVGAKEEIYEWKGKQTCSCKEQTNCSPYSPPPLLYLPAPRLPPTGGSYKCNSCSAPVW